MPIKPTSRQFSDDQIHLRRPRAEEIDRLAPLAFHVLKESAEYAVYNIDLERAKQNARRWIGGEDRYFVRIAEDSNGKVLGFFVGQVYARWFTRDISATDEMVFVSPQARGRGVGKAMLQAFISWAREKGAVKFFLGDTLGISLEASKALYISAGFREAGHIYGAD
jgi:GNAT superfamily N-acetyltransferase